MNLKILFFLFLLCLFSSLTFNELAVRQVDSDSYPDYDLKQMTPYNHLGGNMTEPNGDPLPGGGWPT